MWQESGEDEKHTQDFGGKGHCFEDMAIYVEG
jgi:hypothetical protein